MRTPHHPHHQHQRSRRDFGPEFGFGPEFFGPGPFGPGPGRRGRGRGRRRRGGDVRAAALLILAEAPAHGYHVIQQIAERSEGAWTPSPGSIYPALQQLEDEGLIEFERVDGRKTARLTEAGTAYVEEHREALGEPWSEEELGGAAPAENVAFIQALKQVMQAAKQILTTGTPDQAAAATKVLTDARKSLYGILAED